MDPKPRLSCEQCRRRKTKCDKQAPCTSCKSAGLVCEAVQRDRLPRGKSGKSRKKGGLLEHRVSRIEELLALAQQGLPAKPERKASSSGASPASNASSGDVESTKRLNSYVASDFWTVLSQEVAGLRETFDEASDDEGLSPPDLVNAYSNMEISANYGQMLFGHSPASIKTYVPPYPPNDLRTTLLATYKYRADTICKVLHWPTTLAQIEEANARDHDGSSMSEQALEFSIYCTAVCTISDEEALMMLPSDRSALLQQYMQATEVALAQSSLMQRPDTTGLLAFVLYINCVWACGKYATKWTLVALAARIGEALGLGREDPKMYSPFELECRRRLWYCVGLLDTHCSYDRGSGPLMDSAALGPMPLDINDADMHPDSKDLVPSSGFTDMAFTLLTFQAALHNKRLCEAADWEAKLQIAQNYQDIADRAISVASGGSLLEKMTQYCARSIASNVHLLLRRPPYKQRSNIVPESDDFDIMGYAITVLDTFLHKKRDLEVWEWKDWIPWYALAVILAELCKTPTGPVADQAWVLAQELYQRYSRPASDLETGMLWKPLTKLMRRVQRERPSPLPTAAIPTNASIPASQTVMDMPDYAATTSSNTAPFTYGGAIDMSNGQGQPLPTQPWSSGEVPAWPVFGLYPSASSNTDNRGLNSKLYNDLDPANGVSWLDWDTFLDDPSYGMTIG